jgi:hypothetical protein
MTFVGNKEEEEEEEEYHKHHHLYLQLQAVKNSDDQDPVSAPKSNTLAHGLNYTLLLDYKLTLGLTHI